MNGNRTQSLEGEGVVSGVIQVTTPGTVIKVRRLSATEQTIADLVRLAATCDDVGDVSGLRDCLRSIGQEVGVEFPA